MLIQKRFKSSLLLMFLTLVLFFYTLLGAFFTAQRVEAVVPLAPVVAGVLGSLLVDTAIDMGVKFLDKKAETDFKNKAVGDLWTKYGDKIDDLKPTKKNAGKWALEIPKWLVGLAVDYVADTAYEVHEGHDNRQDINTNMFLPSDISYPVGDPFANTAVNINIVPSTKKGNLANNTRYLAYLKEWTDVRVKPVAYAARTEIAFAWRGDFKNAFKIYVAGGTDATIYFDFKLSHNTREWFFWSNDTPTEDYDTNKIFYVDDVLNVKAAYGRDTSSTNYVDFDDGIASFNKYLERLESSHGKIYYSDGKIVTAGYQSYVNFPNVSATGQQIIYTPEAIDKIKHPAIRPIELEFDIGDLNLVLPEWSDIAAGDNFDFDIIQNDIINQITNNNFNSVTYITNNYNDYTTYNSIINNFYTTDNDIVIGGDDDGDGGANNGNGGVCTSDCTIVINDGAVINVGDGAVINIDTPDDFFDKLVFVFVPSDYTFIEQQVKRLMQIINDKLPTSHLQDLIESLFVSNANNPLDNIDFEIKTLNMRFEMPDIDGAWIVTLKRLVTAVLALYTLIYVYRKIFGTGGVVEK